MVEHAATRRHRGVLCHISLVTHQSRCGCALAAMEIVVAAAMEAARVRTPPCHLMPTRPTGCDDAIHHLTLVLSRSLPLYVTSWFLLTPCRFFFLIGGSIYYLHPLWHSMLLLVHTYMTLSGGGKALRWEREIERERRKELCLFQSSQHNELKYVI